MSRTIVTRAISIIMAASMQAATPSSVAGQTFLITGKAGNECRKASLPCITCSIGCMQVATQELAERLPALWPLPRGMSLWPIRTGKRQLLLSKGSRLRHQMPRWRQCTWIWHPSGVLKLAVMVPRQDRWHTSSTPGDLRVHSAQGGHQAESQQQAPAVASFCFQAIAGSADRCFVALQKHQRVCQGGGGS